MTYEYHVFVSYPHAGHVGEWTRNHLAPTLRECLADEYPYPQFRDSQKYLSFHDAVVDLAQRIAARLANVPPWDPDWPTAFPGPPPDPGPPSLPRL
jgi:hypothetical protein